MLRHSWCFILFRKKDYIFTLHLYYKNCCCYYFVWWGLLILYYFRIMKISVHSTKPASGVDPGFSLKGGVHYEIVYFKFAQLIYIYIYIYIFFFFRMYVHVYRLAVLKIPLSIPTFLWLKSNYMYILISDKQDFKIIWSHSCTIIVILASDVIVINRHIYKRKIIYTVLIKN